MPDYGQRAAVDLTPRNGLSHVLGERQPPLWHKTIPALLAEAVTCFGEREAVVFPAQNIRWSYHELARQVDALAAGLLATGLKAGERIGIWSPNRVEWIVLQYASARIGLILVNINPAYRLTELEYGSVKLIAKRL